MTSFKRRFQITFHSSVYVQSSNSKPWDSPAVPALMLQREIPAAFTDPGDLHPLVGLLSVATQGAVNTQDSETLGGVSRLQMMAMCSGDNLSHWQI